jgi:hypothetical protein
LHRFIGIPLGADRAVIKQYLNDNPHRANWYFTKKFEIFRKMYLEDYLKCSPEHGGYVWYRFEWQHRDAIHVHGVARKGDAPDLVALTEKAIEGHALGELQGDNPDNYTSEMTSCVTSGQDAERQLIEFHDQYICTDMLNPYVEYVTPDADIPKRTLPMKKTVSEVLETSEDAQRVDTEDLIVCLQRHNCKVGRCLKQRDGHALVCRWRFPKERTLVTTIEYSRGKIKGAATGPWILDIVPKRKNDQRINTHNPEVLKLTRANGDFSLTHDPVRVERYVTKFASKGETKSGVFKSAFTEIFENAREGETDTRLALKRVMTKVLGSRDVSRAEALHCLQDIPLHDSNVTIVRESLQS